MLWKWWTRFLAGSLMVGITLGQQPESPKNTSPGAQIVRVRTGTDCGRCVGYSASETSFEPGWMVS